MSILSLPLEPQLHINDWRATLVLAVVSLALKGPEAAALGANLLCVVFAGLIALRLVESRPVGPCTTRVLPPPLVM